jgi:predicted ATP-binding protein involved in virulence
VAKPSGSLSPLGTAAERAGLGSLCDGLPHRTLWSGLARHAPWLCFSLALLGNSDGQVSVSPPPSRRAAAIVEQLLAGSLPQWEALREHLGLLAEASPEAFLHRIEQSLAQEPNHQTPQESPAPSLMLALSSALGLLALDIDLLPKVALVLAKLFESENLSTANRKHSQPLKVLQEVFNPPLPKTNATSEERLAALAPLIQQAPKAAWALLLTLLHGQSMTALTVPRPLILPLSVPSLRRFSSGAAIYGQLEQLLSWAMELAGTDGEKWAEILEVGPRLPSELLLTALRRIATLVPDLHDEQQVLWGALRSLLSIYEPEQKAQGEAGANQTKQRQQRREPAEVLAQALYQQLQPADFIAQHAWLFAKQPRLPIRYTTREEHHQLLLVEQHRCITDLAARPDRMVLLARLRARVHDMSRLASLLSESTWAEELEQQLPQLEACGPDLAIWFLAFRLRSRDFAEVEGWLQRLQAEGRPTDAALLAQLLTGGGAERDAQLWTVLDSLGEPASRMYWQNLEVFRISEAAPTKSTERAIRHFMDVGRWETAKTAAVVLKEPVSTTLRLELLRRAREALTQPNKHGFSYQVNWIELWDSLTPQTPEELAAARREEAAWLPALWDTYYRARFVPAWVTDDPQAFVDLVDLVDLVHADTAKALLVCWKGWPGDSLPPEQGQERLYSWAKAVLAKLESSAQPRAFNAPAMVLARPTGSDGLWPGDALRRLLEDEQRSGTSALYDALLSVRRDAPMVEARIVDEWVKSSHKLATECDKSAKQLALTWPTAAKLCHKLAESYRETAGDWQERIEMWNERDGLKQEPSMLGPLFPLTKLEIKNFRGIAETTLPELHPRLNILYGRNASGKTTLLDALAIALGELAARLPQELQEKSGELPALQSTDRHLKTGSKEPAKQLRIAVTGQLHRGAPLSWQVERSYARGAESQDRESPVLRPYLDALNERLRIGDPRVLLPVFAYYSVERALGEKAKQGETPSDRDRSRLDGLAGALRGSERFEQATEWFRREYFIAQQERDEKPGYERPSLREVMQAVSLAVMTPEGVGLKKLRIGKDLKLEVDFVRPGLDEQKLTIGQLSDGFRTHLALVMDLARRMAESNPLPEGEREQPNFGCSSRAVVLIDEVDAHLHPSWQWTVLEGLLAAFPQAQFFVTTHSPLVLGSIRNADAKIWLMEDGKVSQVGQLYGKTIDDILEDYQDTAYRKNVMQALIDKVRKLLNEGKLDEADTDIKRIEALNSDLTELVGLRNRLLLARQGLSSPPKSGEKPPV